MANHFYGFFGELEVRHGLRGPSSELTIAQGWLMGVLGWLGLHGLDVLQWLGSWILMFVGGVVG